MEPSIDTAETELRLRLRRQAHLCLTRALALYTPQLKELTQRAQPPAAVDSFVSVLRNATKRGVSVHDTDLLAYTHALVELLTNIGGGDGLRRETQLLDLFDGVGTQLFESGHSTTDLRLIMARYSSSISNGGERRRAIIIKALQESRSDDEQLRALLVLAKYHIDISNYERAHQILAQCDTVADRAPTRPAQRYDIHTTRGIALFYRNHTLARRSLIRGISLDEAETDPIICRASATALHFLGRIAAARGDHHAALAFLVLAQHYKGRVTMEGTQLGYYHLRLGEVLSVAGSAESGLWHLEQAGRLFQNVRQRSTAEAQLNNALAGIAMTNGDRRRAEYLLNDAIESARRDFYPRGELVFLVQLLRLQIRRGAVRSASRTILRSIQLWRRAELGGGNWIIKQTRVSTFPQALARKLGHHGRRAPSSQPCPCPQHEATSVAELRQCIGLPGIVTQRIAAQSRSSSGASS